MWYGAAVKDQQIIATCFSKEEQDLKHRLSKKLPSHIQIRATDEPNQFLTEVMKALEDIFKGKDKENYMFKIDTSHLTNYSRSVLSSTCQIPVGYVTTYGALAKVAGGIARSVGQVEASNPVPLLIPCHRVICSDLSIGGYGYGKRTKLELLMRENRGYKRSKKIKVDEKELTLFPAEMVKQAQDRF
jgi:methylated-DNA-[protein]-cysteine S-methyltransferase